MTRRPIAVSGLIGIALAISSCAEEQVESRNLPGAAFGPDHEAMRRHALQPIRLRQVRRPRPAANGIAPARQTAAGPQFVEAALPVILSKVDTQLYRRGYLAQRYLSPGYDASFTELTLWLERYSALESARAIYRLARRRKPSGAVMPKRPPGSAPPPLTVPPALDPSPKLPGRPRLSKEDREKASALRRSITGAISGRRLSRAAELLDGTATRLLGAARADALRARLGHLLLQRGRFATAYRVTAAAAKRSTRYVTLAPWIAGLSAWTLERWPDAITHFERLARAGNDHQWLMAGAAYWAGRSHARAGDAASANHWFGRAAAYSRTFYGALARQRLGLAPAFDWRQPIADPDSFRTFVSSKTGRRIVALVQIGAYNAAGRRLLYLYRQQGQSNPETMLAIAVAGRMPAAAFRLAEQMARRDGRWFDIALFPVPVWRPTNRFKTDWAIIFAVMRQESGYRPAAVSGAGARGLMQIMPNTARFAAGQAGIRFAGTGALFDPAVNLQLGDQFLDYLLARPTIERNLLFAFAAYNAGEGSLSNWRVRSDPLLFAEAIHFRETRIFVERVLYNLWAYRARLGQKAPSLQALADNRWPLYVHQDPANDR